MTGVVFSLVGALTSCAGTAGPGAHGITPGKGPQGPEVQKQVSALDPVKPLPTTEAQKQADAAVDRWFQMFPTRRAYLQVDKPLYQPGETIWLRAHFRNSRDLTAWGGAGSTVQLVSPKGAVVLQKRVLAQDGMVAADFDLPDEAQGGEYQIRFIGDDGTQEKRTIVVASYDAPRLKKDLEFLRKAYGPGDQVSAALSVSRATGEPFASKKLVAVVTVDDGEVQRVNVTTDAKGQAVVKFKLPEQIAHEDALLTVLADDGGVTESIQKRIPIVLQTLDVALYPEGGQLVASLPGRVYFAATNTIGKPADVEGRVVDDRGETVAAFKSLHDGMGRFEIVPQQGRRYHVEIDKPQNITKKFDLPAAQQDGCALMSMDDFDSQKDELRVATWCTKDQTVILESVLRERRLASAAIEVTAQKPAVVALPMSRVEQGAVRVTLFDEDRAPLAERLIYRGRKQDMHVSITADKKTYSPRDPVTLTIKTTDLAGKPVQASVALSVADDTVLSFADDKSSNILAKLYLESELGPDQTIEEPNFYFGDDKDAPAAMDLLMGTKGWRKFEWRYVMHPGQYGYRGYNGVDTTTAVGAVPEEELEAPMAAAPPPPADAPRPMGGAVKGAPAKRPAAPAGKAAAGPARPKQQADKNANLDQRDNKLAEKKQEMPRRERKMRAGGGGAGGGGRGQVAGGEAMKDEDFAGDDDGEMDNAQMGWAPVRVFPAPTYKPGYDGPRDDFRETIFWSPDVRTAKDGTAKVTFYVSDAITSFRATAEGVSLGGLPGRGDTLVQSKLPVSLDVRMPLEVSQGDHIELPITLTNETDHDMPANVQATFGAAFKQGASPFDRPVMLKAGEKRAFFMPLDVTGNKGEGEVEIAMQTQGLKDEVHKSIRVVPLGFPFQVSLAGTAKGGQTMKHEVDLTGAMPGSITASVIMYPSPLASMTQGAAAMIREPGGCFEQTSATNYPNIMVMNYLQSNDAADPAIVADASGKLARGYKLLTGYETKQKGYEWFGESPGHEALTAYGLMEFKDMEGAYDDVDKQMVERTADWLMTRRDGKGGYERNSRALDSFGRASYETTNMYVTWALSEAGRAKGLDRELAYSQKMGLESKDPYLVSLAANTALNVAPSAPETKKIVERMVEMQDKTGAFPGAAQSITMSGGESLTIETTSLATLAMVKASPAGEYETQLRGSVEWLNGKRGGWGEWGNTQGTVLTLKALTAYTEHSRQTQDSGTATVIVNGKEVGKIEFEKGRRESLNFDDIAPALVAGKNTIEIKLASKASIPYSVAIEYRSARPQSSEKATIGIETSLAKQKVKMGEGVKMHAHILNKTDKGQPMTLARIGLPGGLTFQTWQLEELKDKGIIGFYETRQREVIIYFRDMKPSAAVDLDLDLMAVAPGKYVAPASSAYLYYTDEDKSWVAPVAVTVER